jgi:hypothetical protein
MGNIFDIAEESTFIKDDGEVEKKTKNTPKAV